MGLQCRIKTDYYYKFRAMERICGRSISEQRQTIEIREELAKEDTEELGLDIIRDVVMAAIKEMKNNKTEGIDSIPPEVFKCLGRRQ